METISVIIGVVSAILSLIGIIIEVVKLYKEKEITARDWSSRRLFL